MNLTDEQIEAVKELAVLPSYTPQKICLILGIDFEILKNNPEFLNAINAGKLLAEGQFDKKVQALSNAGSGPAQSLLLKMMQNREIQEMREYYG
jgi:hypothetical protein